MHGATHNGGRCPQTRRVSARGRLIRQATGASFDKRRYKVVLFELLSISLERAFIVIDLPQRDL